MPQMFCPHCGQPCAIPPQQWPQGDGRSMTCPQCRQTFAVGAATLPSPISPIAAPPAGAGSSGPLPSPGILATPPKRGLSPWVTAVIAIVVWGLLVLSLFPFGGRALEPANRAKCSGNLRQIALACTMYADSDPHHDYPDSLDRLVNGPLAQDITPSVFICPSSPDVPSTASSPDQIAAGLHSRNHLSYVYCGKGLSGNSTPDAAVLLYEPLSNHVDGSNFAFADAHVEFVPKAKAAAMIADLQKGVNPPTVAPPAPLGRR